MEMSGDVGGAVWMEEDLVEKLKGRHLENLITSGYKVETVFLRLIDK